MAKTKQLTIAQFLKVKSFPFVIKDKNGNQIYFENSNSDWVKKEYDANNNLIYCEYSTGYWYKQEFDANSNDIYFEDSTGYLNDNRPKSTVELTMDEIALKFGIAVKQLKIKK